MQGRIGKKRVALIVCRIGEFSVATMGVTGVGRKQMESLALQLRGFLAKYDFAIFSSSVVYALESADVLVSGLGGNGPFSRQELWVDAAHPPDYIAIDQLVDHAFRRSPVVIFVTHETVCKEYPSRYAAQVLGRDIPEEALNPGQARLIWIDPQKWPQVI